MDNSGHWHPDMESALKANRAMDQFLPEDHPRRQRCAISIAIGEVVTVVKKSGERAKFTFNSAEKNRVILAPWGRGQLPYLELAEHVQLQRDNGEEVPAQVWDNRRGNIILRTLPV
jgi:hypothetical protein